MGIYRFILSILVVMSHVGIMIHGYNPGVVAVVSFFLLTGYVMTIVIEKYYRSAARVPAFYLDRLARIGPQFLFHMTLAALVIGLLHIESPLIDQLTPLKWALNFLILPQGYYMYWATGALPIPQTWSLGLELTFYLVFPWILIKLPRRGVYALSALSLVVFFAAVLGLLHTDHFGYRLLPGTLFIFLVGSSFASRRRDAALYRGLVYAIMLALFGMLLANQALYHALYSKEVIVGLLIGIPLMHAARSLRYSRIDEFLGNLGYGVFLNHFILIWVIQRATPGSAVEQTNLPLLLALSCLCALLTYMLVERPALRWRHGMRALTQDAASTAAMI